MKHKEIDAEYVEKPPGDELDDIVVSYGTYMGVQIRNFKCQLAKDCVHTSKHTVCGG